MTAAPIESGVVPFQAEGRLLQELGERLVASPETALVELLKNSYDADAQTCRVEVGKDSASLLIRDDGTGMTKAQFLGRWMKIATAHKLEEPTSPRFGRTRTGQKGIGRFAVRFLGSHLVLDTVADDPVLKKRLRLHAEFDWKEIDKAVDLRNVQITYTLNAADSTPTGTTLRVERLRHPLDFLSSKNFKTDVLRIVSPLESLERGRFKRPAKKNFEVDPGFSVALPSTGEDDEVDIASEVLGRAWARLLIDVSDRRIQYTVHLASGKKPKVLSVPLDLKIRAGLTADVRFFPRRPGVFSGGSVDGRAAWSWVRDNCGVAVVDHGFRIRPFGFQNDDWLHLDLDAAHNERDWRSQVAKAHFPISSEVRARPADNPALNLPSNFQLVGAVFVESQATGDGDDLAIAMDREGFLDNEAFKQLVEVVRGGVEFLAQVDKQDLAKQQEARAAEAAEHARADFKAAIEEIKGSPTLSKGDKNRLVAHYSELSKKVEEVETYGREARRSLETMGLLGVVAGFMTHEASKILDGLEHAIDRLRKLRGADPALAEALAEIEEGFSAFKGHVQYTSLFVDSMHRSSGFGFKARPQVERILETFGAFARDRNLKCDNEVADDARVEGVPVAAYSGVVLNLYTNALKAVLARQGGASPAQVVIRGWNERGRHFVEVLDKGVGIPPELRQRIFDPLFTTTSNESNPLGSGMGLGLSLVKEVVAHSGGKLQLVEPPAGFSTCFRAEFGGTT